MEILGIIPARYGSKGIPLKNIRLLAGKPLIEYTISTAKKSKINKLIVSTDNEQIAKISKSLGAEVPFIRPKNLARDNSKTIDVIKHVLNFLSNEQNYIPDKIIILQPTSPFRSVQVIDESIKKLNNKISSVVSVSKTTKHPFKSFWIKNGFLTPFEKDHEKKFYQRQKLPPLFYENGLTYTFWNNTIQKFNSIYGPKIKPLLINVESDVLDIDTKFDFFIAEMILSHWKNYSKNF